MLGVEGRCQKSKSWSVLSQDADWIGNETDCREQHCRLEHSGVLSEAAKKRMCFMALCRR